MTQELRKLAEAVRDAKTHNELVLAQTKLDDSLTSRQLLELLDRLEKAEKDAERYRWLRDTGTQGFSNGVPQRGVTIAMDGSVKLHFVYWMTQQQLDKSIDEAMEASK